MKYLRFTCALILCAASLPFGYAAKALNWVALALLRRAERTIDPLVKDLP
jgi:hypothetical protein